MTRAKLSRAVGLAALAAAVAAPSATKAVAFQAKPSDRVQSRGGSELVAYVRSRRVLVYPSLGDRLRHSSGGRALDPPPARQPLATARTTRPKASAPPFATVWAELLRRYVEAILALLHLA